MKLKPLTIALLALFILGVAFLILAIFHHKQVQAATTPTAGTGGTNTGVVGSGSVSTGAGNPVTNSTSPATGTMTTVPISATDVSPWVTAGTGGPGAVTAADNTIYQNAVMAAQSGAQVIPLSLTNAGSLAAGQDVSVSRIVGLRAIMPTL